MRGSRTLETAHLQDWDFRDADTKEGTHVMHSYPAMMIPQVAQSLIALLRERHGHAKRLLDPFCGAGTVLVESVRQGVEAWGTDLNPLAVLIAAARTTPMSVRAARDRVADLERRLDTPRSVNPPAFAGIEFWFKPEVIAQLAFIRETIDDVADPLVRRLALVAFSETARLCSNTRNGEFKLYRLGADKLDAFQPDVGATFRRLLRRYLDGLAAYEQELGRAVAYVRRKDARTLAGLADGAFDLMVTSPPYGDSRTTVAYGQFSRLSLEWLGFSADIARTVDRGLLGGRPAGAGAILGASPTLAAGLEEVAAQDAARAREVGAFYADLDRAIAAVARKLRPGALCAWVVANRTVKGVTLRTNRIIPELSVRHGFEWLTDIARNIPNKRMPLANSPSNVAGARSATMTREHVVILRYGGPSAETPEG